MSKSRGFTLVEAVVGILIITVCLASVIRAYMGGVTAVAETWTDTQASISAQAVMDKVLALRWDETGEAGAATPSAALGPDGPEVLSMVYDDVDDYADKVVTEKKFSVRVTVTYVAPAVSGSHMTWIPASPSDTKRVHVSVTGPDGKVAKEMSTLLVNRR